MRVKLLGETHPKHIRPLNDARSVFGLLELSAVQQLVLTSFSFPRPSLGSLLLVHRAIDAGANFISEAFLFAFAAAVSKSSSPVSALSNLRRTSPLTLSPVQQSWARHGEVAEQKGNDVMRCRTSSRRMVLRLPS